MSHINESCLIWMEWVMSHMWIWNVRASFSPVYVWDVRGEYEWARSCCRHLLERCRFSREAWLIHMRHDSLRLVSYETWLLWDMTNIYHRKEYVKWACRDVVSRVRHDWFIWDMTRWDLSHMRHDSLRLVSYETWLVETCLIWHMTRSRHVPYETWLIWDMTNIYYRKEYVKWACSRCRHL